ncbi:MAG: sigma-54-dependent Fis family transcriptional regulator [Deltaproteobacteria bacterium]|nr:sigma-54-dependent Fis family transcriptional regulator [Deltaproteobacteria bacterium]
MSKILVVEDNETMRTGMVTVAARLGHEAMEACDGVSGISVARSFKPDLVLTDLKLGDVDGIEVLRKTKEMNQNCQVIIVTAHGTVESAVEAMRLGAFDFVEKPFGPKLLKAKIDKALEVVEVKAKANRLEEENEALRAEFSLPPDLEELVGKSEAMNKVFRAIGKVAPTDTTVLLTGESGTGKELVAKAIHSRSKRADKVLVKVSCGAIPENLIESELFGHEKGAFTGAIRRKMGRFELAHKGTLFLDEIGELPKPLQVKLLRVLQEREFERVGGEDTLRVDVRLIAATNRNLNLDVKEGRFREDLFYRLNVVPIELPPLRVRTGDIQALAHHFIEKLQVRTGGKAVKIDPHALDMLETYSWPGNVRELENTIERAMVFCEGDTIRTSDLPPSIAGSSLPTHTATRENNRESSPHLGEKPLPELLEEVERNMILQAYEKSNGIKAEAARVLGVKVSALYYKLQKYGIE